MRYSPFFLFSGDEGEDRTTDLALHNLIPCLRRHCRECRLKMLRNKPYSNLRLLNSLSATPCLAPCNGNDFPVGPMFASHRNIPDVWKPIFAWHWPIRRPSFLGPQPRFGDKSLKLEVVSPQNGTAVLKGERITFFVLKLMRIIDSMVGQ